MNGYNILMLAGLAMFMLINFGMITRQETNLPEDMQAGDLFVEPCKIKLQGNLYCLHRRSITCQTHSSFIIH